MTSETRLRREEPQDSSSAAVTAETWPRREEPTGSKSGIDGPLAVRLHRHRLTKLACWFACRWRRRKVCANCSAVVAK